MKQMKRLLGLCLGLWIATVCFATPVYAISITPTDSFFVYDGANVLSDATEQYIVEKNAGLSQSTGAQIVVVTVENTEGLGAQAYTYAIGNEWGVGSAEKNNGVVLLLDIGGDDYHCVQGSGLERSLPTATLSRMLREDLEPDFAVRDYDAGAKRVFDSLFAEVSAVVGYAGTPSGGVQNYPVEQEKGIGFGDVLLTLLVLGAVVLLISSITKKGRAGAPPVQPPMGMYPPPPVYGPQPYQPPFQQPYQRPRNNATPFLMGWMMGNSGNRRRRWFDDDDDNHRGGGGGGFGGFGGGGGFGGFGGGGGGFRGGGGGGFGGGGGGFRGGGAGRGH